MGFPPQPIPAGLPPTGPAGGELAGTYPNPVLKVTGVTSGTYGSAVNVAQFTVDAKGRITLAASTPIVFPVTSVFGRTGAVVAAASDYSLAQIAAGTNHRLALSGASVMGDLAAGTSGQVLTSQGSGADPAWAAAPVTSVFGRTGAVVAAQGDYTGVGVGTYASNAVSLASNASFQNIISKSISGGTLAAGKGLYCVIFGYYYNVTGSTKDLQVQIIYGATTAWGDKAVNMIPSGGNGHPFALSFVLYNQAGVTNSQLLSGKVSMGDNAVGSIAGVGKIVNPDLYSSSFVAGLSEDSTATKTLAVQAQHTATELNLSSHIYIIT